MKYYLPLFSALALFFFTRLAAQDCKPTLTATGATTICAGDTAWLFVAPQPNTTYRWFRDAQEQGFADDTLVAVLASGSYQVEARQRAQQVKRILTGRTERNLFSLGFNGQQILVNGGGFYYYYTLPTQSMVRTSLTLSTQGEEVSFLDTIQTAPYHSLGFSRADSTFGWRVADRLAEFTNDGGQSWYPMPIESTTPLSSIRDLSLKKAYFVNPTTGFLAIEVYYYRAVTHPPALWTYKNGIMRPVNIFRPDYHQYGTGRDENVTDLQFPTDSTGFVLSSTGGIAKTTDAGTTWTIVNPSKGLRSAYFLPYEYNETASRTAARLNAEYAGLGWAVGDSGRILKTIDGGLTWLDQSVDAAYQLTKVYFTSELDGYAVGKGGLLLSTQDGGASWTRWETPTQEDLNDLLFTDADHGWAVGNKGVILQLNATSCQSLSEPVVVTVNPVPAPPTITASGDLKLVSSAPTGNQWYLNGTAVQGATGTEYSPMSAGTYSVTTTQSGCASGMSEGFTFTVTSDELSLASAAAVYPNPTSEQLYVKLKALGQPVSLELYSLQGVRVAQKNVAATIRETVVPLGLEGLPTGAYVLRIRSGTFSQSSKVLVNR
ncbi:hypothetical protein GCM10027275_30910 [Rhabdobacter roseus]|uniref:Photosystem II stability/assembly factor-like uncharacterized protein n=1 Tax=Rhabdobacter roseus TaxID=1655419 RepID=A0A840TYT4_9BACT|nr:YCF48-related protein [Rhabdobacter roseus]MBB5285050.1 photosystem II stability/assembly factor-like uncharacterized protein [Rhabdobacter roseus]